MITSLFEVLSEALGATPIIAFGAAFLWGVLSIVLSPCHLASIPLIVGFIDDQGRITTKRAFLLSLLFSVGILVTIALIGVVTAMMGRMMGDIGAWSNYVMAGIFFIIGLHLLGVISLPFMKGVKQPGVEKKGLIPSFLLGLVFGIALGPCSFAYMAPILAITFSISSTQLLYGIMLLCMYGVGHCSVIVFAGTFAELVEKYLRWNEHSKGTVLVKKLCGVLVIIGGVYLILSC